jgi:hypothetical protein
MMIVFPLLLSANFASTKEDVQREITELNACLDVLEIVADLVAQTYISQLISKTNALAAGTYQINSEELKTGIVSSTKSFINKTYPNPCY